jgi:putative membrane protein
MDPEDVARPPRFDGSELSVSAPIGRTPPEFGCSHAADVDYRFSLANERTYLAWIRTALASVAGGIAAAKALHFHHQSVRWLIACPPIVAGSLVGLEAAARWHRYEQAMRAKVPLPVGQRMKLIAFGLAAYALIALLAVVVGH